MLLDSTFLIDLLDHLDAAEHTLEELIKTDTPVAVSPLTVYEAGLGLREDEYEAFHEILTSITVLPLGFAESQRALAIQRTLYGKGTPIGDIDALIGATAIESPDPRVLTRNVNEFDRIEEIEVESY